MHSKDRFHMERRRCPRYSANLLVALLDDINMPQSYRVRDVGLWGMLLQNQSGAGPGWEPGTAVTVRFSFRNKEKESHDVLLVAAIVQRIEDKGVAVRFHKEETGLLEQIQPYFMDQDEPVVLQTAVGAEDVVVEQTRPRSQRRRHRMPAQETQAETVSTTGKDETETWLAGQTRRSVPRPLSESLSTYVSFGALAISCIALVLAAMPDRTRVVEQQMEVLASQTDQAVNNLNRRIEALNVSLSSFEVESRTRTTTPGMNRAALPAVQVATVHQADSAPPVTEESAQPGTATARPAPKTKGGPWVINLISLNDAGASQRFADKAGKLGITVEQNTARVNNRDIWRVQVSGFESRAAAESFSKKHKTRLGLNDVWIFKSAVN